MQGRILKITNCATIPLMKEQYFRAETLLEDAEELISEVFPGGQQRARIFDPDRSALLALDLQGYFLHPESHAFIPSAVPFLSRINRLSQLFIDHDRPIFFSKHLNTKVDAGNMATWWRELLSADHPLHELDQRLNFQAAEQIVKTQYDAFYNTDLEAALVRAGIKQVLIGGVMTHLCCETTARSAFVRGFEVFFLVDCTACYTRAHHLAAVRNLGHGFATLVTSAEIEDAFLGKRHG